MTINFKVGKFWTHLCLIWSRSLTTAQSTANPADIVFRYAGSGKRGGGVGIILLKSYVLFVLN